MLPTPPIPRPRAPIPPPSPVAGHQLPLPLDLLPGPAPPVLLPSLASFSVRRVWGTLTPATRQQVRSVVLHVLQEVLTHADHDVRHHRAKCDECDDQHHHDVALAGH